MKIRTGFVSNSSSSSFVIAVDKNINKCPHCGRSDMNILQLIEKASYYNSDNNVVAEGKDDIIKELASWYDDDKSIEKIKKYDDTDKTLALVEVSYHDDVLNDLIHNSGNIEILHECG